MDLSQLDKVYNLYRFKKLPINNPDVRAYAYSTRYFANADIVIVNLETSESMLETVQAEVESLGYAVTIRRYSSVHEADEALFNGFFDIQGSIRQIQKSYKDYTKKISDVILGEYEYVKSEYLDVEFNNNRSDSLIDTIINDISQSGPVLVVLEAAAGFGKTSTSYEILKSLISKHEYNDIPLFIELSRNRQASIFKYVLYDEIDRKFTGINLDLVIKHIAGGRIPIIIDGFDELLKPMRIDRTEDKFEDAEPMLETIRELLKGDAKIILTTRKTAIFAGDEFHAWLESNSGDFSFSRYSISTPTLSDWIEPTREKELQRAGFNLRSIANPVLLSYLRSMSEEDFQACISNLDLIINNYMTALMKREEERQELIMEVEEQKQFLKVISEHFIKNDITSDTKESIEKLLFNSNHSLLSQIVERYSSKSRITLDQLISKLTMHAFLDRKGDNDDQVGFVNDFVLGTFAGDNLIALKDEFICSDRFVDYILTAYIPRNLDTRRTIYTLLNMNLIDMVSVEKKIYIDNYLFGGINHEVNGEYISSMEFRNDFSFDVNVTDTIFSDCEFYNISFDFQKVKKVYFINCSFFDCEVNATEIEENEIHFNNCQSSPDILSELVEADQFAVITANEETGESYFERRVLEKFWPLGKERFTPDKRQETLRLGAAADEMDGIDNAIESLTKRGIIIKRKGYYALHLNIDRIDEIKHILGR